MTLLVIKVKWTKLTEYFSSHTEPLKHFTLEPHAQVYTSICRLVGKLGVKCLTQGHITMSQMESNLQPSNCYFWFENA